MIIGVPLATPTIYWKTVAAILEMDRPADSDLMVFQGALVDRARNFIVEQTLQHPIRPTHLLFLDSDIVVAPDTLHQLLKANRPIVSGLYRRRLPPHEPMAFRREGKKFSPVSASGSLQKVDRVGGGCLLIQRKVFEKIKPPWFSIVEGPNGYLSEDFYFCEKAREAGFEIWLDPAVRPWHLEPVGIGTAEDGSVLVKPLFENL